MSKQDRKAQGNSIRHLTHMESAAMNEGAIELGRQMAGAAYQKGYADGYASCQQETTRQIEQLPSIQHGNPQPGLFDATPLIRRIDVLALLTHPTVRSQEEKET